jgi:hypothetical protein
MRLPRFRVWALMVVVFLVGAALWAGIALLVPPENQYTIYYRDLAWSMVAQQRYCYRLERRALAEGREKEAAGYAALARTFAEKERWCWEKRREYAHWPSGARE